MPTIGLPGWLVLAKGPLVFEPGVEESEGELSAVYIGKLTLQADIDRNRSQSNGNQALYSSRQAAGSGKLIAAGQGAGIVDTARGATSAGLEISRSSQGHGGEREYGKECELHLDL